MNVTEMGKLLATVSLIDPRVSRRDDAEKLLMAKAWLQVIGDDIPFEFAAQCAKTHYQKNETTFMPVHIVEKWRIERDRLRSIEEQKQLQEAPRSKGMPDEVRAKFAEMGFNLTR